jgi:hypothetical protein
LVNILLDNPMTQFPFEWILSLNRLCQKWGQVQYLASSLKMMLKVSYPPNSSPNIIGPIWDCGIGGES